MSEVAVDAQQRTIALITEYARERNISEGGNELVQRGAAKGLYEPKPWHLAFREIAHGSDYIDLLMSCLPDTPPNGKEGSLGILAELDSKLKSRNIQVHIIPKSTKDVKNVTYFTGEEDHSVTFEMSPETRAMHFCPADEKEITMIIDGQPKKVMIAKRMPGATALLFVKEEVLDDPFETLMSTGHELGHQFELEQEQTIVDADGNKYEGYTFYSEVPSALFSIAAGNSFNAKYSAKLNNLYTLSEGVSLYNTVLDIQ